MRDLELLESLVIWMDVHDLFCTCGYILFFDSMMMQIFDLHMDVDEHGLDALSMSRGCLYFLLLLC